MKKSHVFIRLVIRIIVFGIFASIFQNISATNAQSQSCSLLYGDTIFSDVEGQGTLGCTFNGEKGDLIVPECVNCLLNSFSILDPNGNSISYLNPLPASGQYSVQLPYAFQGDLVCGSISYTTQSSCEVNANNYCDQVGGSMFGQEWCPRNAIQQSSASGTLFFSLDRAAIHVPGILIYSKWFGEDTLVTSKVYGVYRLEKDGSETRLTQDGKSDDADLSPDKSQIVYVVYNDPVQDSGGQIYIMDANGDNAHPLTRGKKDSLPRWSPDGKQILYRSDRDGNFDVYVMNADGSNQQNLTKSSSSERSPRWSPDGKMIYFHSDRSGSNQIYSMNSDGSNVNQITANDGKTTNIRPVPSPDGTKIAFASDRDKKGSNADGSDTFELYVMNVDGSNPIRLTNYYYDDIPLAWSPDSSQIVFFSDPTKLMLIDADGKNSGRIVLSPGTRASGIASWVGDGPIVPFATATITPTFTATFTPTITPTPSDTPTATITPTASDTPTPSNTPTITPTYTPSSTFTATFTPTITLTPSITPTPSNTPTPTDDPNAPIGIGRKVQIGSLEPGFPMRNSPSMKAKIVKTLPRSTHATIIDGPQAVSEMSNRNVPQDFIWWQIRTSDGVEGWIQEAYYGEPILIPFSDANVITPVDCTLSTIRPITIRSGPGTNYDQVASRAGADQILAANGQFGDNTQPDQHWWQLIAGFWIRDDQVRESGNCASLPLITVQ